MTALNCRCDAYDTRHHAGHGLCKRDQPEPAAWQGSRVTNPNTPQQRIVHPGVNTAGQAERELLEQAHLVADDMRPDHAPRPWCDGRECLSPHCRADMDPADPYDDAPVIAFPPVEPNYIAAIDDPELIAIHTTLCTLRELDGDQQRRVLDYVLHRCGLEWNLR